MPIYWRAGASQPSRTSGSAFSIYRYITGAAHAVIPIQRQHAHKIATSDILHSALSKEDASRFRKCGGRGDTIIQTRQSEACRTVFAGDENRGSETAEARERTDRDRRKRRLDSESAKEKDTGYRY